MNIVQPSSHVIADVRFNTSQKMQRLQKIRKKQCRYVRLLERYLDFYVWNVMDYRTTVSLTVEY